MNCLLDTHIFLWWVLDNPKLRVEKRERISRSNSKLFLSAASAWEMAIKAQVGKLELPESVIEFTRKQLLLNDIKSLDVSTEHALTVFKLPLHHKRSIRSALAPCARIVVTATGDLIVAGKNKKQGARLDPNHVILGNLQA